MTNTAVKISLSDLQSGKFDHLLDEAFGPDSLGIILISDLPTEYKELRKRVLRSASLLAKLDDEILKLMECPEAYWLVGWSLGKEKLTIKTKKEGVQSASEDDYEITKKPDYFKGSYYINCSFFKDAKLEGPPEEECAKFEQHKAYTTLNRWPTLAEAKFEVMKDFEANCKKLCNLIISISLVVAKSCDKFIGSNLDSEFPPGYLESVVRNSYTTKARLLHYYPKTESETKQESENTWCGEHLDHSCLTGLTSAMFLDESKIKSKSLWELSQLDLETDLQELDASPDAEAGLYIKNRHGQVVKVSIPKDCLAFQTGSALQEISQNKFKAVPHYVKGCNVANIARNTLAVFCQPNLGDKVNASETFSQYADRILNANH